MNNPKVLQLKRYNIWAMSTSFHVIKSGHELAQSRTQREAEDAEGAHPDLIRPKR